MITEKQARTALKGFGCTTPVEYTAIDALRAAGLIAGCANCTPTPEPDRPLLGDFRRECCARNYPGCTLDPEVTAEIERRQAAIDEFAWEVWSHAGTLIQFAPKDSEGLCYRGRNLIAALAKARKAGITKVGA